MSSDLSSQLTKWRLQAGVLAQQYDDLIPVVKAKMAEQAEQIEQLLARIAELEGQTETPADPTKPAESPSGTTIPPANEIIDAEGNLWTLEDRPENPIRINGKAAGYSRNVDALAYVDGRVVQTNQAGNSWEWVNGGWQSAPSQSQPPQQDKPPAKPAPRPTPGTMKIGTQPGKPLYWGSQWLWANCVRQATNRDGVLLVYADINGQYPGGPYSIKWDGGGWVSIDGQRLTAPGFATVTPDSSGMTIIPSGDVRNLDVRPADVPESALFHPRMIELLQPFHVLRAMDLYQTNAARVSRWHERTQPNALNQDGPTGIAYEHAISLANAAGCDLWHTTPINADADYCNKLGRLTRDMLAPDAVVYLEMGNEIWNTMFAGAKEIAKATGTEHYGDEGFRAEWAKRMRVQFAAFAEGFGDDSRLVRVIGSQAANVWLSEKLIALMGDEWDAIAIAPYWPHEAKGDDAESILRHTRAKLQGESYKWMRDHAKLADKHGKRALIYEFGPHYTVDLSGIWTDKLREINEHPLMGEMLGETIERARDLNYEAVCHFNFVEKWTKWGGWGSLQHMTDDPQKSPKMAALLKALGV